jgi:beta-galactosidase
MTNRFMLVLVGLAFFAAARQQMAFADDSPRERVLLDENWRFTRGDPANVDPASLLYDVLPIAKGEDQRERLAEATQEAATPGLARHQVLKPWIVPTGNRFVKDPARRFTRPAGEPRDDIAYVQTDFDDSGWSKVNLPHDWAIEGPFNTGGVGGGMGRLPSPGVGWYRRKLDIPAAAAGKSIFLQVEGAMSYATVWLNGKLVGGWPHGYASWQVDLTSYIVPGADNQLAIRLDNPPDFSRWYPGAGIYRDVWLLETKPVHVGQWGTFVTTSHVSAKSARVDLKVTVDNDSKKDSTVNVATAIYAVDTNDHLDGPAVATMRPVRVRVPAGGRSDAEASAVVAKPRLWGPAPLQRPNRYVAVTTIFREGNVIDRYETRFGIRHVEYKPDGLYVNGQRVRIQGVNQHHDLGALGAAFNLRAAERQLQELQEMGCNAIRMAHNPPAPQLLELTDRMGLLVLDEIFDAWVRQKTPFDFHLIFRDWHEQDLRAFIRRDRNHPSVILWSVGNEVGEQSNAEAGAKIARELVGIAHDEDPTRPATASMNSAKPTSAFAAALDVISLNYQGEGIRDTAEFANYTGLKATPQYDAFRRKFPDRLMFSSESASALSSRDSYLFPVATAISNPIRDGNGGDSRIQQVSAYELYAADFGSSPDKVFAAQDEHPYVAGEFVWSGWDYLGEPTPYYSSRSSYSGIIDLAGFRKDRFYLYQARWQPDLPMAHILPHWTWPDRIGQVTPVHVFTSGDEAELFLNGRSLGRKKKAPFEYRLRWDDVVYQPGTLKVVTYRNGAEWASDEVTTAGDPAQLRAVADRSVIRADGGDLAFVTVSVTDQHGIINPRADNRVHFGIEGSGEIVASDNGNPTDLEAFASHDRKVFHGKALLIVRSRPGQAGTMRITASAEGLASAEISVVTALMPLAPAAE